MIDGKRVIATVSARMGSTRLPGKVLMPLLGEPVLERIIERVARGKYFDEIVIATSTSKKDDAIETFAIERGYAIYRGSEDDVLSRLAGLAREHRSDIVYRGMGDSPLVDHRIVDDLIEKLAEGGYDLVSNEMGEHPVPDGFDATVFTAKALLEGDETAMHPEMREHVTIHIKTDPERYRTLVLSAEPPLFGSPYRLTLDTKEDYELITKVYEALYPTDPDFSAVDTVRFLDAHPEVARINAGVAQKVPDLLSRPV